MTKEWDKFLSDYKKLLQRAKSYSLSEGEKKKKKLQADLKTAWAKEDVMREAIAKAKQAGVSGTTSKDFKIDKGYVASLAAWKQAVTAHRAQVNALESYCKDADKLLVPWKKQHDSLAKDFKGLKTSTEPAADKKKFKEVYTASAKTVADLTGTANLMGTLKAHEIFYALRLKPSIEQILKESLKQSGGTDMPKLLEEATRNKNVSLAKKIGKSIFRLSETAVKEGASNARVSQKSLKMAADHLKKLEKLNGEYQSAQKKLAKTIEASKDKKWMLDAIDKIAATHKEAEGILKGAEKDVKAAMA